MFLLLIIMKVIILNIFIYSLDYIKAFISVQHLCLILVQCVRCSGTDFILCNINDKSALANLSLTLLTSSSSSSRQNTSVPFLKQFQCCYVRDVRARRRYRGVSNQRLECLVRLHLIFRSGSTEQQTSKPRKRLLLFNKKLNKNKQVPIVNSGISYCAVTQLKMLLC